ncbi:hypothetical protein AAG906_001642 [Vitis piasezkii]
MRVVSSEAFVRRRVSSGSSFCLYFFCISLTATLVAVFPVALSFIFSDGLCILCYRDFVTVGIVSKFGAFLGIIWTLRHVECRVLVLIWGGELPSVLGGTLARACLVGWAKHSTQMRASGLCRLTVAHMSAIGKGNKCGWTREGVGRTYSKKPTKLFSKREFRERFCILNSISIRLINCGPVPTEKESHKAIVFSKDQFNVGFCLSFPSLFRQFFHFTKIPLAVVYPNAVKVLIGSSILDMLFCLDFSLLKLVMGLPDSTKGAIKGHVVVSCPWAGLLEHLSREFEPRCLLVIPGKKKRGRLVEWRKKASFDQLNKLFVISASERDYQTLLTDQNLLAMVWELQSYVLSILPRLAPKVLVPDEHHTTELLKQVPCFTEPEPRSTNMNDFFSLTNQFFVKMAGDPPIIVVPHLPHGTPESVLSRIKPIQDHTAVKTAEVKTVADGAMLLKEVEEEREVAKTEACWVKEEKEVVEAKCKDAKKKLKELWARFATEKKELEDEYQKQVDNIFFFGYQCCMRKNDITQDIPSYPFDEEHVAVSGPAQGDKDSDAVRPFGGQNWLSMNTCLFLLLPSC